MIKREAIRQVKVKQVEEKKRMKEWESNVNSERLVRKRKYQKSEMKKKVEQYAIKIGRFQRAKQLVMMRTQYNILVMQMRKQLLKERFSVMEIKD